MVQVKRHFMRWQVEQEVKVKFPGSEGFVCAVIHDISLMGMQVSLQEELPMDTSFGLNILLRDGDRLNLEAWVSWHKTQEDKHWYGLYFTLIPDYNKEKICQIISRSRWEGTAVESAENSREVQKDQGTADRRIFQRFSLHCPLYFAESMTGAKYEAQAVDFSGKGLGIVTRTPLEAHTRLAVWLSLPDNGEPLLTYGSVAWSRPLESGAYRVGIDLYSADLVGLSRMMRMPL